MLKSRPNDRNMPTQHIATLLGATCCVRLATVLRCVASCWVLLAQVWNWSNLSQQQPTCRNTVAKRKQHVAPNNVAICCVGMLRSFGRGFNSVDVFCYPFRSPTIVKSCKKWGMSFLESAIRTKMESSPGMSWRCCCPTWMNRSNCSVTRSSTSDSLNWYLNNIGMCGMTIELGI